MAKSNNKQSQSPGQVPDNGIFLQLLSRDRHRLFAFIYSLVPNHNDAEDIFQDTSIVLWNKFHEFDQDRSFASWACGIAYNITRNFLRSAGRNRLVFSDSLLAVIATERAESVENDIERIRALELCIQKLTDRERKLLGQAYGGKSTAKDLACQLNRATQTIYNSLNLIRRKLTECVRNSGAICKSEA